MTLNEYVVSKIIGGEYELKENYIVALYRHFKIEIGSINITIIISRLGKVYIAIEYLDYDSMLVYDEAFEDITYNNAPVYESNFYIFKTSEESSNLIAEKLIKDHASNDGFRKSVIDFLMTNIADARERTLEQPEEYRASYLNGCFEVIISRTIDKLENE